MDQILFTVFAVQAVVAAGLAVTRKNTVAAACWLVLMFFALAGIYVLMQATFVAVIQVLVYAGAIMVLFLFVIMLLDLRSTELAVHTGPRLRWPGILLSAILLGLVVHSVRDAARSEDAVAERVSGTLSVPGEEPVAVEFRGKKAEYRVGERLHEFTLSLPPGETGLRVPVPGEPGAVLEVTVLRGGLDAAPATPDGGPRAVGQALFERWLLPFEIASLLLTAAIFGTVVLTKRRLA